MEKQYEYNGHKYWIKVEPAIDETSGRTFFVAYVNDEKPGAFLYGTTVKNPQGRVMLFETETSALVNANAVKQSEIGTK